MRKRERENPCGICGHYHKYEEGEICGICGHCVPDSSDKLSFPVSAFPSEILPEFLYLGSYDNASRSEILKTQGVTRVLNTVPACQNLYKNSFTYHCLQDERNFQFEDANQFLEQCERDKARVLVHCMSGIKRSPAFVIAFLMKSRGWRLAQSHQWVKDRRPQVQLTEVEYQQLEEYERKIFGSADKNNPGFVTTAAAAAPPLFGVGFPKMNELPPVPTFTTATNTPSIFDHSVPPNEFTFGATPTHLEISANPPGPNSGDVQMD